MMPPAMQNQKVFVEPRNFFGSLLTVAPLYSIPPESNQLFARPLLRLDKFRNPALSLSGCSWLATVNRARIVLSFNHEDTWFSLERLGWSQVLAALLRESTRTDHQVTFELINYQIVLEQRLYVSMKILCNPDEVFFVEVTRSAPAAESATGALLLPRLVRRISTIVLL
jgi:hypothetical protein